MSELYAVRESLDGEFQTGTKEEMEKAYEEAKDTIMDYINDGGSNGDDEVLLLKVVRQAVVVKDEENEDDPKEHGYDYWVKWRDIEPDPRQLTLDELQQMSGQPVWCKGKTRFDTNFEGWKVLQRNENHMAYVRFTDQTAFGAIDYGTTWVAYDRPPKPDCQISDYIESCPDCGFCGEE